MTSVTMNTTVSFALVKMNSSEAEAGWRGFPGASAGLVPLLRDLGQLAFVQDVVLEVAAAGAQVGVHVGAEVDREGGARRGSGEAPPIALALYAVLAGVYVGGAAFGALPVFHVWPLS